ncbi:hypothetical protein TRFO_12206 [Tritrichomonas foetus]|uniref:Phosphoprotein phosphatase n=1 Tax=Tritrichomonas foetus TaxID=1144522 RepID=A0A1J4J097_9EUKA|nr:hypothetical protein TRFO_12206 [Tritrichomonas foetus]|eukprot:OHS92850.1 hypothetical protein TRFO_12206 [Tritrichomonas foetus]
MSLLRRYGKRCSSLSLISPVDSPIHKLFIPSSRRAILPPMAEEDSNNKSNDQNDSNDKNGKDGKKDNKKDDKKKDEEPQVDPDLPTGFMPNSKKVHSNIELPSLPELPLPSNSNFNSILQKKCDLILIELDFLDMEGDVAAKEIRLNTLNELLNVCQNNFESINQNDKNLIYLTIKKILFKDLSPVQPQYLFCDDLVVLIDTAFPQTSIVYQILAIYAKTNSKLLPEIIPLLLKQFAKFDLNERTTVSNIILDIYDSNPSLQNDIMKRVCNILTTYLDKGTGPYVLNPCITFLSNVFKKSADLSKYEPIYNTIILPLLGAVHFQTCSELMVGIVEQFVKAFPNLAMPTISELVRHFPITKSVKTIAFLKMLTTSMTKINTRDFRKNMKQLFNLFVQCTTGPQIKVSDASLGIWHKIELEPLIMDNAKIIFPFVYPILSKGMRENWSSDIINNIDDVFQTMNRIDSFIFQELCRQKQPGPPPSNEKLKTWATIARGAAKTDKGLNLATKLAEIQRIFAVQSLQPIGQVPRTNRSATTLANMPPPQIAKPTNRSNVVIGKIVPLPSFKSP